MPNYSIPTKIQHRYIAGTFFCALFLFFWCYGSSIVHFTIVPDEELRYASASEYNTAWLADGRWATYLLKLVFGTFLINPFYSSVLTALALAGAAAVMHHSVLAASGRSPETGGLSGVVLSSLFVTSPAYPFLLTFSTFDSEIGVATLLAVCAAACSFNTLFAERRHLAQLAAVSLLLMAYSVYQPMLLVWGLAATAFLLAYQLLHVDEDRPRLEIQRLGYLAAAPLIALILDRLIKAIVYSFVSSNQYVDQFISWDRASLWESVDHVARFWAGVLFGGFIGAGAGWYWGLALALLALALLAITATRRRRRMVGYVLLAIFCLFPFSLSLVLGGGVPLRTLYPFSLAVALPPTLVYLSARRRFLRQLLVGGALLVAVLNAQWINHAFISDYRRYNYDRFVGEQIGLRLATLSAEAHGSQLTVAIVGEIRADERTFGFKREAIGFSLFEWEGGNPYRVVSFLRALGFTFIAGPTQSQLRQALQSSRTMGIWPAAASIRQVGGIVVVKLSEPTPEQIASYGH